MIHQETQRLIDRICPNPDRIKGLEIQEKLNAILTYETLPHQIDYVMPYKTKANRANTWLQRNLSDEHYTKLMRRLNLRIEHYHGPYGAGQYDKLF